MACGRIVDKLLSEPMLTLFIDAQMRHLGEKSLDTEAGWRICESVNLVLIGSDNGMPPFWPLTIYYLKQCWLMINLNHINRLQIKFNKRKRMLLIHENTFENVVCKLVTVWTSSLNASYSNSPAKITNITIFGSTNDFRYLWAEILIRGQSDPLYTTCIFSY